ncbi:MAG: tRNA dihydrouridine synthase DusB [Tissierellia bacterium]|nr:tRNA dihydrouridine synthase DusB [Tissierellia bacterium]
MLIGNLELDNNVFLAPLAGYTDQAFRRMCKKHGVGLMYTEMVSAKAMYYGDKKTKSLLSIAKEEMPVGIQIFGSDPFIMSKVVDEYLNTDDRIALIDINMGCPAPKIVKNGDGSALLENPELVYDIVKSIVSITDKPVTAKIRLGIRGNLNYMKVAEKIELAGGSALTVHGRTREMYYSGESDWEKIAEVANHLSIPVIGNGDIGSAEKGIYRLQTSNCAGISIGRGAIGNPFIFNQIKDALNGNEIVEPTIKEVFETLYEHYELTCELKGEKVGVMEMRKHINHYLKGLYGAAEVKNTINGLDSIEEVLKVLKEYEKRLDKQQVFV